MNYKGITWNNDLVQKSFTLGAAFDPHVKFASLVVSESVVRDLHFIGLYKIESFCFKLFFQDHSPPKKDWPTLSFSINIFGQSSLIPARSSANHCLGFFSLRYLGDKSLCRKHQSCN